MTDYATMKDIGKEYGLTSHQVGNLLKKNKLRTADGKPTSLAFDLRMVDQKFDGFGHYVWAWHVSKMHMFLERLGHKRASDTLTD